MRSTTLLDNLNSDLLASFSALLPKGSAQRVLVYVESDDDIAFWRSILIPFEVHGISFEIHSPIKNALEKGKNQALKKGQEILNMNTGTHLIVCVDSDYDYLLQNTTETSSKINNSEYIFQTYSYSIENLQCYGGSIHSVCVQSTKNDNKIIDYEELIKLYSNIIYKLFLWSVYFSLKQDTTVFPLSEFCKTIKIIGKADIKEQFKTVLEALKNRVDKKVQELEYRLPNEKSRVEALSEQLRPLGVNENNTYLFAQGHTIKDNVMLLFLKPIIKYLTDEKFEQIRSKAKHQKERDNQINSYKKQIILVDDALSCNTEFKSCFIYQKIEKDLDVYIQRLKELHFIS